MMEAEAMEKLNELLPGIEEFLVQILPQEKLSSIAEERRQYFVERLDILKLPPSLPPRAGKRLSTELLEESEETCGIPSELVPELVGLVPEVSAVAVAAEKKEEATGPELSEIEKDFAAKQREISRNLLASVSSEKDIEETDESDSAKGVKVYDDIDPSESAKAAENEDEDEDDINALYEIPIARQQTQPTSEDSLSQPADISSLATAGSVDDISDDVLDASSPGWQPPPLPPRTKKKESESAESRVSTNSLDGKPPELPFRPPLPRRNELYARSEKSDKSEKSEKSDVSDGDSTSYESFDENEHDSELLSKLSIKLPKRPKKKTKTSSKLLSSKARSSSTWEINVPFKKLENVILSGEMQHKGKLSWNRRLVAISNGCLAMYKPDKETRPVFVVPLAGFTASLGDPVGRKGFEMKMCHESGESYTFAVDFKEWAYLWCEHINSLSHGLSVPVYHQHLARTFSGGSDHSGFGSKIDLRLGEGEYESYEECMTDSSSVFGTPPLTPQTPRFKFNYTGSLRSPASTSRLMNRSKTLLPHNRSFSSLASSARTASTLTLSRWDWKTLFYNWSFPLDQVIMGMRRGNLSNSNSNSNLSVSSDGVESDDSSKPRLRANKVMRMGSFAYRATQFFENLTIGKKSSSKRKTSSLSSPTETDFHLRDGIQEESSLSSASIGLPAISPSSEATSPVFEDGFRQSSNFSSPTSLEAPAVPPPLPSTPPPCRPTSVKHQGYLNIFSSFNKRRWGQRWCMIRENMFECYRTQSSQLCELNFLLKNCILRQALAETSSPLAIMLLENNKEKITVEPPTKEELSLWLRVLMVETSTEAVPSGLEEYFVEGDESAMEGMASAMEAEYTDIVGASVIKSWEVGSVSILPNHEKVVVETDETEGSGIEANTPEEESVKPDDKPDDTDDVTPDAPVAEGYLYSEVIKRPSSSTLVQLGEEDAEEEDEELREEQQKVPRFTDNLAVYNANKNTTDSGFYSVKEANSDSESGSEVKTDDVSPTQESSSFAAQGETTLPKCNNLENGISDFTVASGGRRAAEEEEEESALESTMTSDDFKESLETGRNNASSSVNVDTKTESIGVDNEGCENTVKEECVTNISVQENTKDKDHSEAVFSKETHVHTEKVDSQTVNGEDNHQREKSKKKKKKSKSKKNKQKQQDQEPSTSENHTNESVNDIASNPKSQKSRSDNGNPEMSGIPTSSSSTVENSLASSAQRKPVSEDRQLDSAVSEPTTSKASSEISGKLTTNVPTVALDSSLLEMKSESREIHTVYARVETVKSDISSTAVKESCAEMYNKDSQQLDLGSVRSGTSEEKRQLGSFKTNQSIENLLDAWGLSSILTREWTLDDSSATVEGGEDDSSSPREVNSGDIQRELTDSCSGSSFSKTVSGSVGDKEEEGCSSVGGHSQSNLTSSLQNEEEKPKGPDEDEVITELRERLGRLREKLVQIKRKRIAVRDKRVRAFSAEERAVCDKEYLALESECKATSATIQNLEEELKTATAIAGHRL